MGNLYLLRENRLLPQPTLFPDDRSPSYHEENKGSNFDAEWWGLTHHLIYTYITGRQGGKVEYVGSAIELHK
jgi:hypothetical protein